MVEKIKLSNAAKEIIKNKNKEIKGLTNKLEYSKDVIEDKINIIRDLKKDVKVKVMYVKAFSVLLAAVDERRLAWSLAEAYNSQKEVHDVKQLSKSFLNDMLDPKTTINNMFKEKEKKVNDTSNSLGLDLDKILNDLLGRNKK